MKNYNGLYFYLDEKFEPFKRTEEYLLFQIKGVKEAHLRIDKNIDDKYERAYFAPAHITITGEEKKTCHIFLNMNTDVLRIDNETHVPQDLFIKALEEGKVLFSDLIDSRDEAVYNLYEKQQKIQTKCYSLENSWIQKRRENDLRVWNLFLLRLKDISEKIDLYSFGQETIDTKWYQKHVECTANKLHEIDAAKSKKQQSQKTTVQEQPMRKAASEQTLKQEEQLVENDKLKELIEQTSKPLSVIEYHMVHEELLGYYISQVTGDEKKITKQIQTILDKYERPSDQIFRFMMAFKKESLEQISSYFGGQLAVRMVIKLLTSTHNFSKQQKTNFAKSLGFLLETFDINIGLKSLVEKFTCVEKRQQKELVWTIKEKCLNYEYDDLFHLLNIHYPKLANIRPDLNYTSILDWLVKRPYETQLNYVKLPDSPLMIAQSITLQSDIKSLESLEKRGKKAAPVSQENLRLFAEAKKQGYRYYRKTLLENFFSDLKKTPQEREEILSAYVEHVGPVEATHHLAKSLICSEFKWMPLLGLSDVPKCRFFAEGDRFEQAFTGTDVLSLGFVIKKDQTIYNEQEKQNSLDIMRSFFNNIVEYVKRIKGLELGSDYERSLMKNHEVSKKEKGLFLMLYSLVRVLSACAKVPDVGQMQIEALKLYKDDPHNNERHRENMGALIEALKNSKAVNKKDGCKKMR